MQGSEKRRQKEDVDDEGLDDYIPFVPLKKRKERQVQLNPLRNSNIEHLIIILYKLNPKQILLIKEENEDDKVIGPQANISLIDQTAELKRKQIIKGKNNKERKKRI